MKRINESLKNINISRPILLFMMISCEKDQGNFMCFSFSGLNKCNCTFILLSQNLVAETNLFCVKNITIPAIDQIFGIIISKCHTIFSYNLTKKYETEDFWQIWVLKGFLLRCVISAVWSPSDDFLLPFPDLSSVFLPL